MWTKNRMASAQRSTPARAARAKAKRTRGTVARPVHCCFEAACRRSPSSPRDEGRGRFGHRHDRPDSWRIWPALGIAPWTPSARGRAGALGAYNAGMPKSVITPEENAELVDQI